VQLMDNVFLVILIGYKKFYRYVAECETHTQKNCVSFTVLLLVDGPLLLHRSWHLAAGFLSKLVADCHSAQ
jgi:hypothetical protein